MRPEDRLTSRLRDIQLYGERAKSTVRDRRLEDMEPVEIDALCYLVLIVNEATTQALALDETLVQRHPDIPWREIRATGNRLRHAYATIDLQVVHEVLDKGHIDQLLRLARTELIFCGGKETVRTMATSTLTSKGQMTVPKSIRDRLNLKEGDRLEFVLENDRIVLIPVTFRARDLISVLPKPARAASIGEMDAAIRKRASGKR